jgi:hypothetical protein
MTNPNGAEAHDFIAPPPQEVTQPEQVTALAGSATSDQAASGLAPAKYDILPMSSDDGADQGSDITRTRPETVPVKPDIPPHVLEAAGRAIDSSLAVSPGRMISFGKLLHLAFGDEPLTSHEFPLFKRAVNQDPRARYKGKGRYLI